MACGEHPRLESSVEETWLKGTRKLKEHNPGRVTTTKREESSENSCKAHAAQNMQACRHLAEVSTMVWAHELDSRQAKA